MNIVIKNISFFIILIGIFLLNLNSIISAKQEVFDELQASMIVNDFEVVTIDEIKEIKEEKESVSSVFESAVLEIPKINLKKSLVSPDNPDNEIDKNIKIMPSSSMPNVMEGNFILAAHSGTGRIAFFKNLYQLEPKDLIYLYYNNQKYTYQISNIYPQEKNGTVIINKKAGETTITLITCRYQDKSAQTIYIGSLVV